MDTRQNNLQGNYGVAYATSPTPTGSYPTIAPTLTDPRNNGDNGVVAIHNSGFAPQQALYTFFGTGADGTTFVAKIVGWKLEGNLIDGSWIPTTLAELTCTLGTTKGATGSNGNVKSTNSLCKTLAVVSSLIEPTTPNLIPADNGIQSIILHHYGFQCIQIVFKSGSGTVADCNALVAEY